MWRLSAVAIAFAAGTCAAQPVWVEGFETGLGRFDQTLVLGDSLFTWDETNERMHAEFRRNDASDRRAADLGITLTENDVFGFSCVITPLERDPDNTLAVEGFMGFFNSNDHNLDNSIGIAIIDDLPRFRLFGPGIDSTFRPIAWQRYHDYYVELVYDGPAGVVTWSVYEGGSANGIHLGTYSDVAPSIEVNQLGVGGNAHSFDVNTNYAAYLRAGIDDFAFDRLQPPPCILADTNQDGHTDAADFTFWLGCYNLGLGFPDCETADQNGDGLLTPSDFTAWVANFNSCL